MVIEKDMPARRRVVGVVEARPHPQRPGVGADAAVEGDDLAGQRRRRRAPSGRAVTGAPTLTWPTKRSGMRKSTRMCERSSSVATSVAVLDLVADVDAEDADPAVEGRADHPVLERELGVADGELGLRGRRARSRGA